ncbi:peptidase associated/transthyretin-like domain-containing protein [Hanstruepera marina]|uniref:hypothetical protein n=1 Tax=Hanstruepera marina TaxID=2873265 RepID=UPI002104CB4F|nr:hypothetical protein [Hanstruepera marina]
MKTGFLALIVFSLFFFCLPSQEIMSQTIEIKGEIISDLDNENVHVINKTFKKYAITNKEGSFYLPVRLNDTLVFSSVQHRPYMVVISEEIYHEGNLQVELEEQVNTLDQVVVGKVLSGDILSEIGNVEGEPMTSKKAGISSYQGPPKTQSERRLQDGADLNPKLGGSLGGLGVSVRIIPIINAITGRSKQLKEHVVLEEKERLMYDIKVRLSESLFKMNTLDAKHVMEFFYFVSEEADFLLRCKNQSDMLVLEYLKEKLVVFKNNLNTTKN